MKNKTPQIALIAAIEETTRALGRDNKLLWHLTGDLPRFKKLTEGQVIIMGRKTYESIGKPLPNRQNIVVSNTIRSIAGAAVAHSFENAIAFAKTIDTEKIFCIGGEEIFQSALLVADVLHLTLVSDKEVQADVFFPSYSENFTVSAEESHLDHSPPFRYVDFIKKT